MRGDKHPLLASSHVPHDFGESFRCAADVAALEVSDEGTKILIVTSAQPLEGKTTTAANIAMALAYGGARVLLIDADMRRPGLHRPLRLTNERGLSQVLTGQARVRDVIQRTVDPNLLAITGRHGRRPTRPSCSSSERMKTLLTNLAHGPFDWIIIDTPPVLAVTDAVILAPMVTGVTFVIGAEMTRRRLAERAIETVMQSRPRYAGGRAEQGRLREEQMLLLAVPRPSSTELLRRSHPLISRAAASILLLVVGWTLVGIRRRVSLDDRVPLFAGRRAARGDHAAIDRPWIGRAPRLVAPRVSHRRRPLS